jgi:pyruvate/2-oxoglutarate dehydrogenase complex dihydrolipoamide acyltransferase (E2) component
MPTKLLMPLLGEAVTDATVTKWLKATGDKVEEYEAILEVNTDKVDTEIPSPTSGVILAEYAKEGEVIKVGALLAWIGQPGESISQEGAPGQASDAFAPGQFKNLPDVTALSAKPFEPNPSGVGFISPVVAKIAAEYNVELSKVLGTGMGGRITKKDIENYLEARSQTHPASQVASQPTPTPVNPPSPTPSAESPSLSLLTGTYTVRPQTPIRKAIAEHMVFSEHIAPHVSTIMEVDMSCVSDHRTANKETFAAQGVNLTYTAYFVLASVAALKAYPLVNSSWSEEGVRIFDAINIGMAVSMGEDGLIVPVIRGADNLSLLGTARIVNDLSNRARARKLQPDEVRGGTFTITNHGISGSLFATPIINQPQCAILGVGAIQKRPVVITDSNLGDMISIRQMMYLSLTFDHRIIDGAIADYFLARVVETLRDWT